MLARSLLLVLALALWGSGLWWHWPVWPFELVVRHGARAPVPAADAGPRWLRAEVTRSVPGLEGLALGDHVQFDRYGIVDATAGAVVCAPWHPWSHWPVTVTAIGGKQPYANVLTLDLVPAAVCESAVSEPGAVVSGHAGSAAR